MRKSKGQSQMKTIFNKKQATKAARSLAKFFKHAGTAVSHGQALDALSVMSGFQSWNAMSNALSEESITRALLALERKHLAENADTSYGPECAIATHTGFCLCYSAEEQTPSYVRVIDPLGREVAYWSAEEWQEAPELVMGAILGAVARGTPLVANGGGGCLDTAKPPVIKDVPWLQVNGLVHNGIVMFLNWAEELEAFASGSATSADATICFGFLDKHGFAEQAVFRYADLATLVWDAQQKWFVDEDGGTYEFQIMSSFGR
jgi:hypothetical protein